MPLGHFGLWAVDCQHASSFASRPSEKRASRDAHTVRNGAVVCCLVESVCCEGVADSGVLGLNEFLVDGVVEALHR
jgi:hypothetical protein